MRVSERVVLHVPSNFDPNRPLPVFTQKPWEWVAACISLCVQQHQLFAVHELRARWMYKRLELTVIDHSLGEYVSLAKKAVASGTLFFSINTSLLDMTARLFAFGYEKVASAESGRSGHFLEGYVDFRSSIETILMTNPGVVCCFSHDAELVHLFSS